VEAAWGIVLGAHAGEDDVVFGATRACRGTGLPEGAEMAGVLVNTLPVRVRIAGRATVGALLGDAIEIAALTRAYRASTSARGYCAIGSVKPNISHLGEATGIAGFIKAVLALSHRELPPSLHCERPSPQVDFPSTPFYVNTEARAWRATGEPRRAGVTALGAGGTKAHVILEEAPCSAPSRSSRPPDLLVLSAKTPAALQAATRNLARHLRDHPEQDLADVAYTLRVGLKAFAHRRALLCRDREDAIGALDTPAPPRAGSGRPDLEALAQRWVDGVELWSELLPAERRRD
jgi:acyl transferase domain-containing protein